MRQVTCPHCARTVTMSPDAVLCPNCGENVERSLPNEPIFGAVSDATPETVPEIHLSEVGSAPSAPNQAFDQLPDIFSNPIARQHYERATQLATAQNVSAALDEVDQGLATAPTAELLLLAAILAQRLGRFDAMRRYVSQIPINDSLREEGEWLLRSHQSRQRDQRQQTQQQRTQGQRPFAVSSQTDAPRPASTGIPQTTAQPRSPWRMQWTFVIAVVLMVLAAWGTWSVLNRALRSGDDLPAVGDTQPNNPLPAVPTTMPAVTSDSDAMGVDASDADATAVQPESVDGTTDATSGADATAPTVGVPDNSPEPTPANIPADVVDAAETPEPLADSTPASAAQITGSRPFDILNVLQEAGRSDLAQLPVDAQLQAGNLVVFGMVPWAEQRREILEIVETIPDVDAVNAVDLVVRLPDTYTVQEGDTLWLIAYRLYDDAARWEDVLAFNQDILASPEALRVGMTLQVPPAQ